jgi:hypothetical protein
MVTGEPANEKKVVRILFRRGNNGKPFASEVRFPDDLFASYGSKGPAIDHVVKCGSAEPLNPIVPLLLIAQRSALDHLLFRQLRLLP